MYFLRHGESEFNARFGETGRDPGIHDAPLTKRGIAQAEGAAKHFLNLKNNGARQKPPARILTSPYTRALQTAAPVAKALDLPLTVNALLGERRLYSCDIGTCLADLKPRWPVADFSGIEKDTWWPQTQEGEDELRQRVQAFCALENRAREEALGEALVISHWYFIFTVTGLDCDNCQIIWRDPAGKFHRQA